MQFIYLRGLCGFFYLLFFFFNSTQGKFNQEGNYFYINIFILISTILATFQLQL